MDDVEKATDDRRQDSRSMQPLPPSSSTSSSSSLDDSFDSDELYSADSNATTTTAATEVYVVEGGATDSAIVDSDDDDYTWHGFNPYDELAEDHSSWDTIDFDSSDEEEDDEEEDEITEDEGFDESEQSSDNDREGNADQMHSLFMHLKATIKLDVCYNCTLGRTKITNFDECCEELDCDFDYEEIFAFVCALMDVRGKIDETDNPTIPGYHKENLIRGAILRFFQEFVMCRECGHRMERADGTCMYSIGAECPSCSFNKKIELAHSVVE